MVINIAIRLGSKIGTRSCQATSKSNALLTNRGVEHNEKIEMDFTIFERFTKKIV